MLAMAHATAVLCAAIVHTRVRRSGAPEKCIGSDGSGAAWTPVSTVHARSLLRPPRHALVERGCRRERDFVLSCLALETHP